MIFFCLACSKFANLFIEKRTCWWHLLLLFYPVASGSESSVRFQISLCFVLQPTFMGPSEEIQVNKKKLLGFEFIPASFSGVRYRLEI